MGAQQSYGKVVNTTPEYVDKSDNAEVLKIYRNSQDGKWYTVDHLGASKEFKPSSYFKLLEAGLGADNEQEVADDGDYIVKIDLWGQHTGVGESAGLIKSLVYKGGEAVANDIAEHRHTVPLNGQVTYTHTALITGVLRGQKIGFGLTLTQVDFKNGSLTVTKVN